MNYLIGQLSFDSVLEFLQETETELPEPLSSKLDLKAYAKKLSEYSVFVYCVESERIIGMISCYMNNPPHAYISHVIVRNKYRKVGVFSYLFKHLTEELKQLQFDDVQLEVDAKNVIAHEVYSRLGFVLSHRASERSFYMRYSLSE